MSLFKLSMCLSAFAVAVFALPNASTAAGKADGNLGTRNLSALGGNSVANKPVSVGDGRAAVRSSLGQVTTATRNLDLGTLSVADFGDEPAPVDHR